MFYVKSVKDSNQNLLLYVERVLKLSIQIYLGRFDDYSLILLTGGRNSADQLILA